SHQHREVVGPRPDAAGAMIVPVRWWRGPTGRGRRLLFVPLVLGAAGTPGRACPGATRGRLAPRTSPGLPTWPGAAPAAHRGRLRRGDLAPLHCVQVENRGRRALARAQELAA